jgi:SRSO17 transposase
MDWFRTKTSHPFVKARQYICGLFQANKSNMEQMAETVGGVNYHQIQHFISESPWSAATVMDGVAADVSELFQPYEDVCLLFDESSHIKNGNKSVGVARQYCGQLGKVENCQSAVYAALSVENYYALIDTRLFIPQSWTSDKARCKAAGIPKEGMVFNTRLELALEMVQKHKQMGTRFHWIGGDGLYGHDSQFRRAIAEQNLLYMLDIHSNDGVYVEKPSIGVVVKTSGKGKKPIHPKADKPSLKVKDIAGGLSQEQWKTYTIREGTKGPLQVQIWVQEVYTWDGKETEARAELLVMRRIKNEAGEYEYKYTLSNADPAKYSWLHLAKIQGQRHFIERSFEDVKQEAGMSDYQVRGWLAWHHHMALVMLSLAFVLTEKIAYKEEFPLLSARDVREIMVRTYAQNEDVMLVIKNRHKRRQVDIDRRYKAATG